MQSGLAVSVPLSWKDGTPVAHMVQKLRPGGKQVMDAYEEARFDALRLEDERPDSAQPPGGRARRPRAIAASSGLGNGAGGGPIGVGARGLLEPALGMCKPTARGLGLDPLEAHVQTFDYQSRRLDAALSNLF